MNVQLLAHTPEPERIVAAAAKLCYSSASIADLAAIESDRAAEFIDKLPEAHQSPVEHASFTFAIEGVSRTLLAQITRHRIASFSVQSQRYVSKTDFPYIIPPEIDAVPEAREEFLKAMEEDAAHYESIRQKLIARYLADGMDACAAEKKANEDARFVLPNACDTRIIMTMNVRSLLHFFSLRCCQRAQWEIRAVADEMLRLCKEVAPEIFAKAGAGCVRGRCPEGKMGCKG